ncbi:matrixin family metalloprotease [Yoonia sp. GPGPB17]|uniref:matrixin family metalloprotease n=1 Tax=Yoonia sp. GPGPB17 TaxID=3026147 RepID=UPI0030BC1E45
MTGARAANSAAAASFTYSMDLSQTSFRGSSLTIADFEQSVREALATWAAVANLNFTEASGAGAAPRSHIYIETTSAPVSGAPSSWGQPGGVIGYGGQRNFGEGGFQRYAWQDAAETWAPFGSGGTNYFLVAGHEIGHALGLPHNSNGTQLMNPTISRQKGVYEGDIEAMVAIYGEREWTNGADDIFMKYVQVGQTVKAKGGNDTILATSKADTIYGGAKRNDDIASSAYNDRIFDSLGSNKIDAGDNDDIIVGGAGKTDARGGSGNDIIIGGKGDDTLNGGGGNDTIRGDAQESFFYGDDVITAGRGNDFLEGGGGSDTFVFRPGEGTNTIATLRISGNNPNNTAATGADFESGVDVVDLRAFDFDSRLEAFMNVRDANGNAQFSSQGTTIIFYDLNLADLSENDFLV